MKPKLFLITATYPNTPGDEFIKNEIPFLESNFDLTIVPTDLRAPLKEQKSKIDLSLSKLFTKKSIWLKAILKTIFSKDFLIQYKLERRNNKHFKFKAFLGCLTRARISSIFFKKLQSEEKIILYFYWLDYQILGARRIKNSNTIMIARGHGYEVFESNTNKFYIPLQLEKINILDQLFIISKAGKDYLLQKFQNKITTKIKVSYLGVLTQKPNFQTPNKLRLAIVSVSYCVKCKRINLIIDLIKKIREYIDVEWHHIGNGDEFTLIQKYADDELKSGFVLHGHVDNENVIKLLLNDNFHCFINLSENEGIPVSMMESLSCGLPIIATNVGGVAEIFEGFDCGWLLEKDFNLDQTALTLVEELTNIAKLERKSIIAYKNFNTRFNASVNYENFCKNILGLFNQ